MLVDLCLRIAYQMSPFTVVKTTLTPDEREALQLSKLELLSGEGQRVKNEPEARDDYAWILNKPELRSVAAPQWLKMLPKDH